MGVNGTGYFLFQMGLKSIFDIKEANFKGIFDTTSLKDNIFVSDVVQKAFIEVNEGGTVAAAATSNYLDFFNYSMHFLHTWCI